MNKIPLKIALIIMPIAVWWTSGMLLVSGISMFMQPPINLHYSGSSTDVSFSYSLTPFYGYAILCLSIYASIKLWVKYIEN